jgi:hypothetical protein
MKTLTIYIASSWQHQHAVEMLTSIFRLNNYHVTSWVENNYGENHNHVTKKFDFETWVNSKESEQSFLFDTIGAMSCDIFVYLGRAGKDAAAECGMAYASGKPMFALYSKGEDFGLMRKMFKSWHYRISDLVDTITNFSILYF